MSASNAWLGFGGGVVGLIMVAVAIVALILWFFLPFAVFGIKDKVSKLIATQERTNQLLADLAMRPTHSPLQFSDVRVGPTRTEARRAEAVVPSGPGHSA